MTLIPETRTTVEGRIYKVVVPDKYASDNAYDHWFVAHLREFLYRRGTSVAHIPDELLLTQVRNTFANTSTRQGRISSAKPLQSE